MCARLIGFVYNFSWSIFELHNNLLLLLSFSLVLVRIVENRVVVSMSTHVKDELFARVEVIKRNVKNLLKIVKRDSWICDRQPEEHGKYDAFRSIIGVISASFLPFVCVIRL